MLDKQVCPNCGQLYDTGLAKCPLCGTAAQVVEVETPAQRKRLSELERKQRRAERKEAEQEEKRRRKDEQLLQDAEEERQLEEAAQRKKEEKRRRKEEKKAARSKQSDEPATQTEQPEEAAADSPAPAADPKPAPIPAAKPAPVVTPAPARTGQRPVIQERVAPRDRGRVPRFFLVASTLVLLVALVVGGSYLLWKLDVVKLPIYDRLAAQKESAEATQDPVSSHSEADRTTETTETEPFRPGVVCTALTLAQSEITLTQAGDQTQIGVTVEPENTTDEKIFKSSDETVVKVSPVGIVTAVSPGAAIVTVTCGSKVAQCTVYCDYAEESGDTSSVDVDHLVLLKDDMTFFHPDESYVLSVTNLPAGTAVTWTSLDESVATVDETGHVKAVGPGTTRVIATVGELRAECWVRCRFE